MKSIQAHSTTVAPKATFRIRRGLTFGLGVTLATWSFYSFTRFTAGEFHLLSHLLGTVPALYFLCICIHDGVHGVLLPRKSLNQVAGFFLSLGVALPFPLLQASHLKHHRRVGHEDDPEHIVYGVSLYGLLLRLPLIPFYYLRSFSTLKTAHKVGTFLHISCVAVLFFAASAYFDAPTVALGWGLPALIAIAWFGFTTVYVPHCEHADRWMQFLTTHSGWHFDHHQDARYPFNQYVQLRHFHLGNGVFDGTALEKAVIGFLARPVAFSTTVEKMRSQGSLR